MAALAVQAVLAGRAHLGIAAPLSISLAASVAGAAGARARYVVLNRGRVEGIPTQGLCIQGFIAAAAAVLMAGLALAGLPVLMCQHRACSSAWRSAARDASCTAAARGG